MTNSCLRYTLPLWLECIARHMNTSVQELERTYCAADALMPLAAEQDALCNQFNSDIQAALDVEVEEPELEPEPEPEPESEQEPESEPEAHLVRRSGALRIVAPTRGEFCRVLGVNRFVADVENRGIKPVKKVRRKMKKKKRKKATFRLDSKKRRVFALRR